MTDMSKPTDIDKLWHDRNEAWDKWREHQREADKWARKAEELDDKLYEHYRHPALRGERRKDQIALDNLAAAMGTDHLDAIGSTGCKTAATTHE